MDDYDDVRYEYRDLLHKHDTHRPKEWILTNRPVAKMLVGLHAMFFGLRAISYSTSLRYELTLVT